MIRNISVFAFLSALEVGKPSPTYKRIKVVLDQFVNEVQGDGEKEKEFENLELQTHTKWLGSLS
jgi:hypothetical protein